MARKMKRGATRAPAPTVREPIEWNKVSRLFSLIAVIVLFTASSFYLVKEDTLPILHVTVEGDFDHVDRKQFIDQVTPYVSGSFMSVDVDKIQHAAESLPWVKQTQVRRVWPDGVHFIIEEHTAVAQWGERGLVSDNGELFFPPMNTLPKSLAVLNGPKNNYQLMAQRYREMNKQLAAEQLNIAELVLDERRSWTMTLSNGIKVELGRVDSERRFQRFMTVYQKRLKHYESEIVAMDMRYTNGLSVQWKHKQKPDFNETV